MVKFEVIPTAIINKMVEHQASQGNRRNPEIFKKALDTPKSLGGFNWGSTPEGQMFWSRIINYGMFEDFFLMYPDAKDKVFIVEDKVESPSFKVGDHVGIPLVGKKGLKEAVILAIIEENLLPYVVVPKSAYNQIAGGGAVRSWVCAYKEVFELPKPKEKKEYVKLTLKDISEGLGVGIDPSLIKVVK